MTMYDRLLIIDTETGGLDADTNAILEIAGLVWQQIPDGPSLILGKFRYAVNDPDGVVEDEALAINGIDMATHKGQNPQIVVGGIRDFIEQVYYENGEYKPEADFGVVLGGHNTQFDVSFLKRLFLLSGLTVKGRDSDYEKMFSHRLLDTCGIVRYLVLSGVLPLKGASSKEAFEYYGVYPKNAHSALADAEATAKLLDCLIGEQITNHHEHKIVSDTDSYRPGGPTRTREQIEAVVHKVKNDATS